MRKLKRQSQQCLATAHARTILNRQRSAVRLSNLARKDQTNTGPIYLSGEERNEQVGGAEQTGPFVSDPDFDLRAVVVPANFDAAFRFQ
jgi:hypothetical protein